MNKKLIIIITVIILVLILATGTYFGIKFFQKSGNLNFSGFNTDDAVKGVLPSISTNVLENKPDINPADAGNPIKNVKTNPFE